MFVIKGMMLPSVPWRLRQEDSKFKAILCYTEPVSKKKKKVLASVMTHVQV